ncbi:MAG: hypothetical protein ACRD38_03590 [Nitrososphaerales archaeon]
MTVTVDNSLMFDRKEMPNETSSDFIPLPSIVDLHLGFDDNFIGKDSKGKRYQLQPVRIKYKENDSIKTVYVFAEFKGLFRSSSSEEIYKVLKSMINM